MSVQERMQCHQLKPTTRAAVRGLIRSVNDSIDYHQEVARRVRNEMAAAMFRRIANERREVASQLQDMVGIDEAPGREEGTFLRGVTKIWTALRSGLNIGDPAVVLVEAERAEDGIMARFNEILPRVSGGPIYERLRALYEVVRAGHDSVHAMRDTIPQN